ncbi:methyltransferase domain-containing protein [Fictibacillus enclensis]|uniref:class I SAM-dependent methyltransferase n=1 Tax=Fictibacillus enclensis TaxID=1017270 RepID=UPI0025A0182C|nr:class I SAM-dependent methyltransferase [Fictibacillus enclensis]MDM5335841.1 methyltransferase domain-containing protein [Fictibacillus enclensis]
MKVKEEWQDFFKKDYVAFSEVILSPERTKWEVEQLCSLLQLPKGARILDLGCGQGRISIPLQKLGYQVVGMDISNDLLEVARNRAKEENLVLPFFHEDMRDLSVLNEFDAIINLGTAFGYVQDSRENHTIYQNIFNALKPGGIFIQDTENRDFKVKNHRSRTWDMMNGKSVWSERKFTTKDSRWLEKIFWWEGGFIRNRVLDLRLYSPAELIDMMTANGLEVQSLYGGFDLSEHTVDSSRTVIVAKKGANTK